MLKLFRVAGIQVYLHFTWFIIAVWQIGTLSQRYHVHAQIWGAAEFLTLFLIVLLHEFGHALACRSVGGRADQIVLWPLGGIAFVQPPARPGAYLWSLAAGPLVNVALLPVFSILLGIATRGQWMYFNLDLYKFVYAVWYINWLLLVFNLLPVYPLDGGQIVRAILWFFVGPIRSLKIASVIGFIGAIGFALVAFEAASPADRLWMAILAFFVFERALIGWRQAQALDKMSRTPPPVPPSPPS